MSKDVMGRGKNVFGQGECALVAAEAVGRTDMMRCCTVEGSMEKPSSLSCSSPSSSSSLEMGGAGVKGNPTMSNTVANDH